MCSRDDRNVYTMESHTIILGDGPVVIYSRQKKKEHPLLFLLQIVVEKLNISINLKYCLLQFDASNVFLKVRLHWWSVSNFNFFQFKP